MKKIGMIVAIEREMASVLNRYGTAAEVKTISGFTVHTYENDGYTLYVLNCGAGEIWAAAGVQFLITQFQVEMIVNFGVVGGLTPEMAQTHTCIVKKVVQHDFDLSPIDPVVRGEHEEFGGLYIPVSDDLVTRALEIEPSLKPVICASGDQFIDSAEEKQALHETYDADICEMEAAAIAMVCHRNGIPCLLIKTVSDSLMGGAEEFTTGVRKTAEQCFLIADRIIKEL